MKAIDAVRSARARSGPEFTNEFRRTDYGEKVQSVVWQEEKIKVEGSGALRRRSSSGSENQFAALVDSMREAAQKHLSDNGSNDTVRIHLDGHYADGDLTILDKHADYLVKSTSVEVIVAAGGPQSALAAMDATNEADEPRDDLPVVFTTVADPEGLGLVEKEKAPGWNLTGMAGETSENDPKRLALLHEYVLPFKPNATKIGVLVNRSRPDGTSNIGI